MHNKCEIADNMTIYDMISVSLFSCETHQVGDDCSIELFNEASLYTQYPCKLLPVLVYGLN